jgi:hypothetical protein
VSVGPQVARKPRTSFFAIPSDRAAFRAHLGALAILAFETVFWMAQPCIGDVLCAPVVGVYTLFMLVPIAVGVAVWRLARRPSLVVLVDALFLSLLLPLSLRGLTIDPILFLLLPGLPLLLVFGVLGPIADLGAHRIERRLVIAILGAASIYSLITGSFVFLPVPAAITLLLAVGRPVRRPETTPIAADHAPDDPTDDPTDDAPDDASDDPPADWPRPWTTPTTSG